MPIEYSNNIINMMTICKRYSKNNNNNYNELRRRQIHKYIIIIIIVIIVVREYKWFTVNE